MNCDEAKKLLGAYVDHELSPVDDSAVRAHLDSCEACRTEVVALTALRSAVMDQPRFTMPAGFMDRIERALPPDKPDIKSEEKRRAWPWLNGFAIAPFVAGVLCASLMWFIVVGRPNGSDPLAEEVVSSHIRSLMPGHLLDVTSSDRHTVKPWFSGKVGIAPSPWDLSKDGFTLLGGRLDYIGGKRTPVIVYGHNKHVINLFVWPLSDVSGLHNQTVLGYHMVVWLNGGLEYVAVSDMDLPELQRFTRVYTKQIGTGAVEH